MDRSLHGNPFAKAAVDIALWDLWARSRGVSVASLVADREPVEWIPTRVSIGAIRPRRRCGWPSSSGTRGVRTLKFKTGMPGIDDVARLRAVRERLGPEPVFTIDANGAHATADEAVSAIEALLPFNLALAEQPTPRDRIGLLAEVRRRVPVPILADEAVFTPGHLDEALDLDAFDILSIYPGQERRLHPLAGHGPARRRPRGRPARSARTSRPTSARRRWRAWPRASRPSRWIAYACDLMGALFYESSSVTPPIAFRDGRVKAPTGPGFGVEPHAVRD